jgi:hypothetical protein
MRMHQRLAMNAGTNEREFTEANLEESDKFKAHKNNAKCNKCKKPGHYARECKALRHVIERMKKKSHPKQDQLRSNSPRADRTQAYCQACEKAGHSTAECKVLRAFKRDRHHT